ncbi:MAG TPA: sigma-54 dependent transcriptional regulator [candidate division Zixibacteria bacterium]|nr:sigma-54-dependent Fis family transcriptional regulator [candidate division Zixibacteria bacterium]MDD4917830.1 sigma-54 dependent transcriptional regulator [candidate division Zixibacteria bacterium]MDM7974194.1 sigma-54 dependent transcriptional regulator [candidate division Zixibacteria bacterium]HOD66883.1 sigma-54 dependent transcriptional regulator [candidate division Zixibacteria bacterium]HPM38068.1 sigma-54 dependent transcriptional regulator [candidate division Zixibacteria bacteri
MSKSGQILIVDDDRMVLEAMLESFTDDYAVLTALSGQEALERIKEHPEIDTIILDIRMARMDGLKAANLIKDIAPEIPIIFHTGFAGNYSEEDIDRDYHPFDFIGKNEPPSRLRRAVKNAVQYHRLGNTGSDLIDAARERYGMVGKSRDMRQIYQRIEQIGPTTSKVMILGPTGSGKELVARALHARSRRADREMMVVNCSQKDPTMVESELFGHTEGSFTGAVANRVGYFEAADGSTLFLDEIGELDPATQAKILRAIEYGEVTPVGTCVKRSVDVRVICATHLDLEEQVRSGAFRMDLYYRLKGVTIRLPALRERREDIPELLDYFIERTCRINGVGLKVFEPSARALLVEFDWPGNVRQLSDTVESLIQLSPGYYITYHDVANHLGYESSAAPNGNSGLAEQVWEFKRMKIVQALDRARGNVIAAGEELKIDPANLRKMIKRLNIES